MQIHLNLKQKIKKNIKSFNKKMTLIIENYLEHLIFYIRKI